IHFVTIPEVHGRRLHVLVDNCPHATQGRVRTIDSYASVRRSRPWLSRKPFRGFLSTGMHHGPFVVGDGWGWRLLGVSWDGGSFETMSHASISPNFLEGHFFWILPLIVDVQKIVSR